MANLRLTRFLRSVIVAIVVALAGQTQAGDSGSPVPVPRAGKPGPPMLLGTSVMSDQNNLLVKSLGFSHAQTDSDHLTVNEPEPGRWDWTNADAGLAAMQKAGMKWQYFPHFHWPPEWYRKSNKFVPSIGLRSKRQLAAISLWSPDIAPWFDHGYAALAQHYGRGTNNLYAIYLGIHGDFGETIFPMGWHPDEKKRFGENGAGLPDFWCGDDFARADFQRFARNKYRTLRRLNHTWGTQFKDFNQVTYPLAASDAKAGIPGTPQDRRYWLDFIQWYCGSMTKFTGEVCRIARHYFPNALLELPVGGGSENVLYGQDTTALPKIAQRYGVHIRSTHGGYASFPQGYAAMIKRIATPCKVYGVPHWLEPPGGITPEGEVSRIMEALSCGNFGFWDWGQNPVSAAPMFREYANYLTRERPVVDVALFFPTTAQRLCPSKDFPPRLAAVGAQLRDVMDFDLLDEELIADDALRLYRVLVWVEGDYIEESTLKTLAAWIKRGGVLVWSCKEAPETVEGRTSLSSALLGLTPNSAWQAGGPLEIQSPAFLRHLNAQLGNRAGATVSGIHGSAVVLGTVEKRPAVWAVRHGKGWVIAAADSDPATFNELVRDVAYNLSKLDATKTDALEVDTDYDGVYTTLLANGEVIVHNFNSAARTNSVDGAKTILPPKSLRSILIK